MAGHAGTPGMPAFDPVLAKAARRANTAFILGILGAAIGVLNIVLYFAFGFILVGYLAIAGAVAIVMGLMARSKLKARDPKAAGKATLGSALGAVGVALFLIGLTLVVVPAAATHTVIMDNEVLPVDADTGGSQAFEITGGKWTMSYDIRGKAGDSFTACIVKDGELQAWVDEVQPTRASGQACRGPGARAQATVELPAGTYELAVYCWNTASSCDLTWNLQGDP